MFCHTALNHASDWLLFESDGFSKLLIVVTGSQSKLERIPLSAVLNNYNLFSSFTYGHNYTALTVELPHFHACTFLFRETSSSCWLWQTPGQPTTTVNTTALTVKLPTTRTPPRLRNPRARSVCGCGGKQWRRIRERVERSSGVTVCRDEKVLKITGQARSLWLVYWRCSEVLLGKSRRLGDTDEIPKETRVLPRWIWAQPYHT